MNVASCSQFVHRKFIDCSQFHCLAVRWKGEYANGEAQDLCAMRALLWCFCGGCETIAHGCEWRELRQCTESERVHQKEMVGGGGVSGQKDFELWYFVLPDPKTCEAIFKTKLQKRKAIFKTLPPLKLQPSLYVHFVIAFRNHVPHPNAPLSLS